MDTLAGLALRSQTAISGLYFLFYVISWPLVIDPLKDYHDKDRLTFNCVPEPIDFTRQRCYDNYISAMSPLLTPFGFAGITFGTLGFFWLCFIVMGGWILRQIEFRKQKKASREQNEESKQRREDKKRKFKVTFACHVFTQLAFLGVMMGLFCGSQSFRFPAEYTCSQTNTTLTTFNKVAVNLTCNDLRYKEKTELNTAIVVIMAISIALCLLTIIHLAVTKKTFLDELLGYIFEKPDETDADLEMNPVGDFDPIIINKIRQLYKKREGTLEPFPWSERFHFDLDDIFTRLVMVNRDIKASGMGRRNIDDMFKIFQPHEECSKPRTVLIEGKPGMGKTTYCNKFVYNWATEKREAEDCLPNFKLVLSLKCRDIGIESDLWKVIDDQVIPRETQEDEKKKFFESISKNQSSVLLVLDGLDELPTSKLQEFSEIIQGRMLPGCHFVVTARHEAGIPVRKVCDTLLEIEGFTEEDAQRYILKYFKTDKNLAEKLLHRLEIDKKLQEVVKNPLNTALLCVLCEDFQGIPQRRTELYMEIVQCVLRRYRKKNGLKANSADDLTDHEDYKGSLEHLGSIALEGLLEDNMYFEEKKLKSHPHDLPGFGLLSVQPGSSKRKRCVTYGFLHKSFQELFAAFYICCQLVSKKISPEGLVADARYFRELKQVLLFTCGRLADQSEKTAEALIKTITNEVNKDELTAEYFPVALECIKECKKEESNFHVKLARTFGSCLKVHAGDLSDNNLGNAGAEVLAGMLKTNTTLTKLKSTKNNLGPAGAEVLADVLKTNTTLTKLDLSYNYLGTAGAKVLADMLKRNTTLTMLNLSINNLGTAGAKVLADMLETNTTLTKLNLSYNELGTTGTEVLADMLKRNTTLTKLNLSCIELDTAGVEVLVDMLKGNTTLTKLNLSYNKLDTAGVEVLVDMLKTNTTLTKLNLSLNNLGTAGAGVIADMLKTNTTLKKLNLSVNKLGSADAALVADSLNVNSTLTKLFLYGNDVSEPVVKKLEEAHGNRVVL